MWKEEEWFDNSLEAESEEQPNLEECDIFLQGFSFVPTEIYNLGVPAGL